MTKYSPDPKRQRELPVNENVVRIAESLADWPSDELATSAALVGRIISARRERSNHLPARLFSEPAWDMMLELLHGELADRPVTVAMLIDASGVSHRAAIRWLNALEAHGLVARGATAETRKSEQVELTNEARRTFRKYFRQVRGDSQA